jgi:hypothetical protein
MKQKRFTKAFEEEAVRLVRTSGGAAKGFISEADGMAAEVGRSVRLGRIWVELDALAGLEPGPGYERAGSSAAGRGRGGRTETAAAGE